MKLPYLIIIVGTCYYKYAIFTHIARRDINRVSFWQEISKLQRSKRWEIQASYDPKSDDVNYINDIIYPPNYYIRRPETVNLHTKRSEASGRVLILHPQVIRDSKWVN